jgi:simple sugar transport system ATP-binding protein
MTLALEMLGICKAFPGVQANDHIDFRLEKGEIHALLGENGAGKTTLMNILYGLYHPDEGQIFLDGKEVKIHEASDAIRQGIGMVHQHFMLIPVFTVAENIMLGMETAKHGILDRETAARRIREFSHQFGLDVDPGAYVKDLPVGVQQRVEIVKALYRKADILILDEPTAVLTPQEANDLFRVMRSLTAQGKSIIFITHKLREVLAIADRITVLRLGQVVGHADPQTATQTQLASQMVGREVELKAHKTRCQPGEVVLQVQDLSVADDRENLRVDGVSFDVHGAEIVGVAGVQGNGQTELVEALTGLRHVLSGSITILGHNTTHASPRQVVELGVAHVPEDRQADGLVLSYPIADNMVLNTYYLPPFAKGVVIQHAEVDKAASERVEQFDVRTPSINTSAGSLSGGNQQKVIVAREFSRPIKLLVASQPTRGLDVGSIEYIHNRIVEKRDDGCAVLLFSTELDEILALSDRIAVMFRGKIAAVLDAGHVTKEYLGLLMAGVSPDEVAAPEQGEEAEAVF